MKALLIWLIPVMAMAIDIPPGYEIVSQDSNRIEIRDPQTGFSRPYLIEPASHKNEEPIPPEITTEDSIRPWYYFERLTTLPWYAALEAADLNHSGTDEIYGWYHEYLYMDTLTSPWNFDILSMGQIGGVTTYGETDGDSLMEFLTYNHHQLSLYESHSYYGYPDTMIWSLGQNCDCILNEKLGDVDNDGLDEIMFYPNGRVWLGYYIYGINDQHDYEYKTAIRFDDYVHDYEGEPSWGDIDSDGKNEIFAGGIHGEIIMFENAADDSFEFVWLGNAGGPNAYSTEFIGDTDHDGLNEFMVSAKNLSIGQDIFSIFESSGDNQFELVYRQAISGNWYSSGDILVGNFTGESESEIALCTGSNIIILRSSANNTWDEILRFRASNDYSYIRKFKIPGSRDIILNPKTSTQVLTDVFRVASSYFPGDVNADGITNGLDIIFLVNYLKYHPEPIPEPRLRADANGDCLVNLLDIAYMVNYYKGLGPPPIPGWCSNDLD